jgi:hypothetical protein
MNKVSLAALIAAAGLVAASAAPAIAREHWEHGRWVRPYPVVVAPYYAPAPVYVAPPPVYYAPPPVVVAPVPSSLNVVVPLRFR